MLQSPPPKAGVTGTCFHTQLLLGCRGSKLRFPHLSIKFITVHRAVFSDQIESKLCFVQRICNWIKYPVSTLKQAVPPLSTAWGIIGTGTKVVNHSRPPQACSVRGQHQACISSATEKGSLLSAYRLEGQSWFSVLSP